jgi:stalled ribosome rescue protein Dom34
VAILVGLEARRATLWSIYSEASKPLAIVKLEHPRTDPQAADHYFERIIDAIRPAIREGVQSIILAVPPKANYNAEFLTHVNAHHTWLAKPKGSQAITFGSVTGFAGNADAVSQLRQEGDFAKILSDATTREGDRIVAFLERALNDSTGNSVVHYTLEDVERDIFSLNPSSPLQPEAILVTDRFLERPSEKGRILRLLQIAQNNHVKTRVISVETPAGNRIDQLGGITCLSVKRPLNAQRGD